MTKKDSWEGALEGMKQKESHNPRAPLKFLVLCLSGVLFLTVSGVAAERQIPQPTAKDKCPVCGMFVAKYPDWVSVITFKDGSRAFFDGPKDMFKYLLHMKRYNPAKNTKDIGFISVTDYYTVLPINAMNAWYVLGSDIFGPMGREFIPFANRSDAKEFMRDHKGERIVKFSEVTNDVMKSLD